LPDEAVSSRYLLAQFPSAEAVLHTDQAFPIEDILNDPRVGDAARALYAQQFKAKSTIFVPLLAGNQQIGYMNAIYQQPMSFPREKQRRLMVLARQAAVAVQSLHSFALAEKRSTDLATLNEMGRALTASLDMTDILENVHLYTSRLMNTDDLYVALYDQELDEVDIRVFGEGEQRVQTAMRRRGGKGITEYVIRSGRPLLINANIKDVADALGFEVFGREALSWLGAPIAAGDNVLGVIAVQSFDTPYLYDESHRDLLTALASQVAIAIENVNLFGQVRARARREQLLREITEMVRGSADVETIMRVAVQEVGRVLGRNTYIQLEQGEEASALPPGNGAAHE
jgi:GAF domain-containing protein